MPDQPAELTSKRSRGQPPHQSTKADRDAVTLMVAGGINQADIARWRGIDLKTLRKHYREELDNGATTVNAMVLAEHIKLIKKGNFPAIKWYQQARLGWRGDTTDEDSKQPDQSMRIVVELVGEPAVKPVTIDHEPRPDNRGGRDAVRKYVQLVG
jgi:hypothetical protein